MISRPAAMMWGRPVKGKPRRSPLGCERRCASPAGNRAGERL